jgi:hypothetical protein
MCLFAPTQHRRWLTAALPGLLLVATLLVSGCGGDGGLNLTGRWKVTKVSEGATTAVGTTYTFDGSKTDFVKEHGTFLYRVGDKQDDGLYPLYVDMSSIGISHFTEYVKVDSTDQIEMYGALTYGLKTEGRDVEANEILQRDPSVNSVSRLETSNASSTLHISAESSGSSTNFPHSTNKLSFSSLRSLRYPRSVNIGALGGRTLLPGCRFDPAERLGYENRVILRCSDLGAESSGFISDNTEHLHPVRLDCASEKPPNISGTLWHCDTVAGSVEIEAYALSQGDVALRYAALVKIADANP